MHTRSLIITLCALGVVVSVSAQEGDKQVFCGKVGDDGLPTGECGGVFFRSAGSSDIGELPSIEGETYKNVSAFHPSSNINRVTVEYYSSDGEGLNSIQLQDYVYQNKANLYDKGYLIPRSRFDQGGAVSTAEGDEKETFYSNFVCAARSLTVASDNSLFKCLSYQTLPSEDEDAAKKMKKWCSENLEGRFGRILAAYCGGGTDGMVLVYQTTGADDMYIHVWPDSSDNEGEAAKKEITKAFSDNPSLTFRRVASNNEAIAINIGQKVYLFGAAENGGSQANKRIVQDAIDPVAGIDSITYFTTNRNPVMLGSIREGSAPSNDWMVPEVAAASYSPCYIGFDIKQKSLVTWGTAAVCNSFSDLDNGISVRQIADNVDKPVHIRVGYDVFAVATEKGTIASWGLYESGASGIFADQVKYTTYPGGKEEPMIAVTRSALAYTKVDGNTICMGKPSYGGTVSDNDIKSMLANKVAEIYGFQDSFVAVSKTGELAIWPNLHTGVYGPVVPQFSRRYSARFAEPLGTFNQIAAKLVWECVYSDWVITQRCSSASLFEEAQRDVIGAPVNANCTEPLNRSTPCDSTSTPSPTEPPKSRSKWTAKAIVGLVVGSLIGVALLGVVYVMWMGRRRTIADEGL